MHTLLEFSRILKVFVVLVNDIYRYLRYCGCLTILTLIRVLGYISFLSFLICAFAQAQPLWLNYNVYLQLEVFPDAWIINYLTVMFTNCGRKDEVNNYRPVSLACRFV